MTASAQSTYELAMRIAQLEGKIRSRAPQLAFTTLEAGAITEVDQMGNVVAAYGQQHDGSHMAMSYVGVTPLEPTPAIVTPGPGELEVEWLGTWVDNGVVPTDFTRVEVHASADPAYLADEASTLYSTIETPRGAVVRLRMPVGVPMYIRLVARNLAGQRGPASVAVEGIAEAILDQAALDAIQADVDAIPADIAAAKQEAIDAAALDAAAKATQAEQDAIAAAALDAQTKADQAEADAIAAAALTAQEKADLAEAAALADAKAYTDAAEQAAIAAAAADAQAKADAAEQAAIDAAALTAQEKADLAEAAAIAAASLDATTKANTAEADAITAAALDAQAKADAAEAAALADANAYTDGKAATTLTDAKTYTDTQVTTSANGKNKTTLSTSDASGPNTAGDLWFKRDGANNIIGQWVGLGGTSWQATALTNAVIANLDAGKINAGSLSADRIATGSIDTSKLTISDTTNLAKNPDIAFGTKEYQGSNLVALPATDATVPAGAPRANVLRVPNRDTYNGSNFGVEDDARYYMECWVACGTSTFPFGMGLEFRDANGGNAIWNIAGGGSGYIPAGTTTWTKFWGYLSVPTGTPQRTMARPWFQVNTNPQGAAAGTWHVTGLRIMRMANSRLIVDGAIEAAKIATDAVEASKIKAGAVVAGKLSANAVLAENISANSVHANKLFVGDMTNLVADGNFTDTTAANWQTLGAYAQGVQVVAGQPNKFKIVTTATGNHEITNRNIFHVVPGEKIYAETWVYGEPTNVGDQSLALQVEIVKADGTKSWPGFSSTTRATVQGVWTKVSGVLTVPADAVNARVMMVAISSANAVGNIYYWRQVWARRQNAGELIVDGAVIASKIATDAVEASKIKAGAVVAGKLAADSVLAANIKAGEIAASHIAANTITAAQIATGAIAADEIAANAVTTAKVDALAITAAKIATNAIEADKIAAGAVVAGKLAADSVLAANIKALEIGTSHLAAGAVVAGKLAAGAVIAGTIAADAVTSSTIVAGAISADKLAVDSVTAIKILAGSVVADKIATDAVTAVKILAGAVTTAKLDALAVTADKIAANAITADKVEAGAIVAGKLAAGAVIAGNIDAGAVTATTIAADALNGKVITGAIIQTDVSGSRMVMGPDPKDVLAPGRLEWWDDHTGTPIEDIPPGIWGGLTNKGNEAEQYALGLSSGRTVGSGDAVIWMRAQPAGSGAYSQIDIQGSRVNFASDIMSIDGYLIMAGSGIVAGAMAPVYATGGTWTSTGSQTVPNNGANVTFIAPPSGRVKITPGGYLRAPSAGSATYLSFELREGGTIGSGTVIIGPNFDRAVANQNTQYIAGEKSFVATGLWPGATYHARTMHFSSAANAVFTGITIMAEPML